MVRQVKSVAAADPLPSPRRRKALVWSFISTQSLGRHSPNGWRGTWAWGGRPWRGRGRRAWRWARRGRGRGAGWGMRHKGRGGQGDSPKRGQWLWGRAQRRRGGLTGPWGWRLGQRGRRGGRGRVYQPHCGGPGLGAGAHLCGSCAAVLRHAQVPQAAARCVTCLQAEGRWSRYWGRA